MGFEGANIAAVEEDTAACRRVDATDAVEDACLASTVGANDGKKVSGIDLEVDAGEGDHTAKVQVYILQGKQHHPCPLPFVRMLQSTALLVRWSKPLSEQAFDFSVAPGKPGSTIRLGQLISIILCAVLLPDHRAWAVCYAPGRSVSTILVVLYRRAL